MKTTMASAKRLVDGAVIAGGMDVVVSPLYAKPGLARLAYNYEYSPSGGADRIAGIERFDGRPSPSGADYNYMKCSADLAGSLAVYDNVVGATSAATGQVFYISGEFVAVTRVTGRFEKEDLKVGGVVKATVVDADPGVDGFFDNDLAKLSFDNLQKDIGKVPGLGPVRGLAILNDVVYAWRDNDTLSAMAIYKSSSSGWVNVPLLYEVGFTGGSSLYAEGSSLTQGGVTAVVKRVVTESGDWTGAAAGRLIIGAPSGGHFTGGAASGGGTCTLTAAESQITLAAGGNVRTVRYAFSTLSSTRLYGCDGVNREFEFDGTVLVPLNTGMSSIRATAVVCHKHYLMYAYVGSVQFSSVGSPYKWSPVVGAGEFATGDQINDLLSIGGQADAASLFITCQNSLHVLYGTSSTNFNLVPLSHISGGQKYAAQDIGGVVTLDTPGIMRYPATRSFGNFTWDHVSTSIRPLVGQQRCSCSVYASNVYKYRLFFADGSAVSGLPVGNKSFAWSVINYGRNIVVALCDDINSVARTFYGDDQGWVYEADVGRSFAGDPIDYGLILHPLSQRSPMVEKSYRNLQVEIQPSSAFIMYTAAQFGRNDDGQSETIETPQIGAGGVYDLTNFDQSYWDTANVGRLILPAEGQGTSIALTVRGTSDRELTHTIYAVSVTYTPRKVIQ